MLKGQRSRKKTQPTTERAKKPQREKDAGAAVSKPPRTGQRVLYFDIETSPNIADVWGMWDQNIGLTQLRESSRIIGFGYKWRSGKPAKWISEYDPKTGELSQQHQMLQAAHELYDQADIVVTYNGDKFDHKRLNTAWVSAGITPPSPSKSLDLFKVVSRNFQFPSKKLAYVADRLIGDTKIQNGGHQLWRDCLDPGVDKKKRRAAWDLMARYCMQDVDLLEPLHTVLEPWLQDSQSFGLIGAPKTAPHCRKCGSSEVRKRGFAYTPTQAYQQYRCDSCGGWTRDTKAHHKLIET